MEKKGEKIKKLCKCYKHYLQQALGKIRGLKSLAVIYECQLLLLLFRSPILAEDAEVAPVFNLDSLER